MKCLCIPATKEAKKVQEAKLKEFGYCPICEEYGKAENTKTLGNTLRVGKKQKIHNKNLQ